MNPPDSNPPVSAATPWATGGVVLAALVVFFVPSTAKALVFDRIQIWQGEWWRLFTCHWVHFSPSHLLWNLAVLLPAGIWSERIEPVRARLLYPVGAVMIGGALYSFEPQLARYGGLSGLTAGFVAFLALAQLRSGAADRWFWRTVLALLAIKIIAEVVLASPLLAHFPDPGVRSVALSHLAGIVAGMLALNVRRKRPA